MSAPLAVIELSKESLVQIAVGPLDTFCWLFGDGNGYGSIYYQGRQQQLHRVSWKINRGPIPSGMLICHKCDVKACFNPDHLFLGTQRDNMTDWSVKYQQRTLKDRMAAKEAMSKIFEGLVGKLKERKLRRL